MKYRQLTKEQFESLHQEFAHFLASQSIDVNEWNQIKKEKPQVAEDEMNVFSDMVWDDVLTKTNYVEHFSKGSKPYNSERNSEIFDLIEKGSSISKGEIFEYFNQLIS